MFGKTKFSCVIFTFVTPLPQEPLASAGFFARGSSYYCSRDYHELFGTKCIVCSSFIEGEGFTVQGRSYHTSCFKCSQCEGKCVGGVMCG